MIYKGFKLVFSLLLCTAFSAAMLAQDATEVSKEELKKFVDIQLLIQEMNQEIQPMMLEAIQENGFDPQRYIELNQADEMGHEMDASEEEIERYQMAKESILELQQEANQQIADSVEESGLDMDRYQEINLAIQRDPQLQAEMMEIMQ
ncbi:MAG: DUF4168 domain-containing protein [Saprospirales bacterium]|jgi:hypothetical protein|nr:MAG: DUF4168 domain-containing protein [Saprospirales bacterium]